jgi:hypothetical protein
MMISSILKPSLLQLWASHGIRVATRCFSSTSSDAGLIEIREYTLKPEGFIDFIKISEEFSSARKERLPFLGMFTADIGACLHKVTHIYHYASFTQRDEIRAACIKDPRFQQYVKLSRPHVQYQENKMMKEAVGLYEALKMPHTRDFAPPPKPSSPPSSPSPLSTYEYRSYQLKPGHTMVPDLVKSFSKGLPDKVKADPGNGVPVAFLYSDVGRLNNVVEIWRYTSHQACVDAREAARKATVWRQALLEVGPNVEHFDTAFLRPVSFSPWQ